MPSLWECGAQRADHARTYRAQVGMARSVLGEGLGRTGLYSLYSNWKTRDVRRVLQSGRIAAAIGKISEGILRESVQQVIWGAENLNGVKRIGRVRASDSARSRMQLCVRPYRILRGFGGPAYGIRRGSAWDSAQFHAAARCRVGITAGERAYGTLRGPKTRDPGKAGAYGTLRAGRTPRGSPVALRLALPLPASPWLAPPQSRPIPKESRPEKRGLPG